MVVKMGDMHCSTGSSAKVSTPEAIEAGYDHGVLTLAIPIAETAKARKIAVNTPHEALTA